MQKLNAFIVYIDGIADNLLTINHITKQNGFYFFTV